MPPCWIASAVIDELAAISAESVLTSYTLSTGRRIVCGDAGFGPPNGLRAGSGLRLVHRRLRHARSEGDEGAAGGVGGLTPWSAALFGLEFEELIISSRVLMRNRVSKGRYSPCDCDDIPMGKCCHGDDPKFTRVSTEWSHSLKAHLRGRRCLAATCMGGCPRRC